MNTDASHAGGRPATRLLRLGLVAVVLALLIAGAILPVFPCLTGHEEAAAAPPPPPRDRFLTSDETPLPLRFVANAGQTDATVRFTVQGAGHTLFFTRREVVFSAVGNAHERAVQSVVRLAFPGAATEMAIEGRLPLPGGANYFVGNDPALWRANVPTYAALAYRDLYPGVDMVYSGQAGQLKSEFHVAPAANPHVIRLAYRGVQGAHITNDGALSLQTALGELVEAPPLAYQDIAGRRHIVDARYAIYANTAAETTGASNTSFVVGFTIGQYDPTQPLVIDPILSYSSFLGGGGSEAAGPSIYDHAVDIALDPSGNMYLAGQTGSNNFPTDTQAIQPLFGGQSDVFVTQLISASGSYTYGYSTYLGGNDTDYANGIAVDAAGVATIVGATRSGNFPVFAAPQPVRGGAYDAFVTQIISQSGVYTFTYSTYLGGNGLEVGHGVALDTGGNAWVVGETTSHDTYTTTTDFFTTTTAIQPGCGGFPVCSGDAFVTQIANTGSYTFSYSSFMGGAGIDRGLAIALDTGDNVFVTGVTGSSDFPVVNAAEPILGLIRAGADIAATAAFTYPDAFAAKIATGGSPAYDYSTYLGGTFPDVGRGIVVDGDGYAWVTGNTASGDLFVTADALQPTYGGGNATSEAGGDGFVSRIVDAGGVYTYGYSTFLGGGSNDIGHDIVLDTTGNIIVVGETASGNFPTHFPVQSSLRGPNDAFVTQLVSGTTALTYGISTYLGGAAADGGRGLAVGSLGDIYLAGHTQSADFPTTGNALDRTLNGSSDAFVTRLGWGGADDHQDRDTDSRGAGWVGSIHARLHQRQPDPGEQCRH